MIEDAGKHEQQQHREPAGDREVPVEIERLGRRRRRGSDGADGQMQAWDKLLDDSQITQLYNYVRARMDKVLPPGRPDEVGPKGGPWVPPASWRP